jgi:hypothetical protein
MEVGIATVLNQRPQLMEINEAVPLPASKNKLKKQKKEKAHSPNRAWPWI